MDKPARVLPEEPGENTGDLRRDHTGTPSVGQRIPEGSGRDLYGAPETGRGDPLRGMAQFERPDHPVLRNCLEIKALDEQECIHADMAFLALVTALLRCPALPVESDRDALVSLTETALQKGTRPLCAGSWKPSTGTHGSRQRLRSGSTCPSLSTGFIMAALPSR